ncbi:hypothetical protein BC834DRAFT_848705, partial [Gloeopeniophorella convolvens]
VARNVFYQENRGEILVLTGQRSNAPAGTPAFFGALQLATSELMTRVTEDQMIELQSTAMEWSETGPPPEIRARCAVKMRGCIIRDFQEQLYKFCGVRTFVLCAFLDEGKVIRACGQEYNKYIEHGTDFKTLIRDWETAPLWSSWRKYSQRCFSTAIPEPVSTTGHLNRVPLPVNLDLEGCPLVPVIEDPSWHHVTVLQRAVRDFLTFHFKFVSGRTNLSIPWSNVKNDQSVWFQDESLPPSLVLQDPSKMSRSDVERLLDYWQQKEEDGVQPVEWKSSCPLLYSIAPRIPVVHRPPPAKHLPTAPIDPTPPPPTSPLASEDQHAPSEEDTPPPSSPRPKRPFSRRALENKLPNPVLVASASRRNLTVNIESRGSTSRRRSNQIIEEDDGPPVLHERGLGGGFVPNIALSAVSTMGKRQPRLSDKAKNVDTGRGGTGTTFNFMKRS